MFDVQDMEERGIPVNWISRWKEWIHWPLILVIIGTAQVTIMRQLNGNIGWIMVCSIPFTITYSFIVYKITSVIKGR